MWSWTTASRVAVVAVRTGTFYRKKMTVGDVYSIGGDVSAPFAFGDSGPGPRRPSSTSAAWR
jgi:hypothetical protein